MSRIACLLLLAALLCWLPGSRPNAADVQAEADAPLPPEVAARTMTVPAGFRVSLFAGEPDVQQPINFCIDDRGRLWVAEAYNYPNHGTKPGDRIIILEDVDGDGRFDKRTVFYDKLNYVTGIEVGFGGAWVVSPPYFYFIPDAGGDDVPDGPPQMLLDGFGNHANSHNLANALAWGPDGWLYGTHGRTNWSLLGKPGTPAKERIRFDGGVYRYHPVRHVWEPFADGTTNPWGIDWDDFGEAFVCNCVNPHLFHVIQGAHYEPWRNRESSQYAYQRIPTIADHLHYTGHGDVHDGLGSPAEDAAGGGHAHCGTMVYLGDNWPDTYRNTVFMHNIHGHRINNDILKRKGSGYTASHGHDLLRAKDPWYMGVTLKYGPDGAVYSSDWSDTGECHSVKNTRRGTGRIYKISYGPPPVAKPETKPAKFDVARLNDIELVQAQLHKNDWHVQHARRVLHERAAAGGDMTEVRRLLHAMFVEQPTIPRKLRALWALQVVGGLDTDFLVRQLEHESEYIRSWAIRLLCENFDPPVAALDRFQALAAKGDSPFVRLQLASALHRLKPEQRWLIAEALLSRGEDALDQNLPLMVWYAVEPLVQSDLARFVALAKTSKLPVVREHVARRAVSLKDPSAALQFLMPLLETADAAVQGDILRGLLQGLEGRRSIARPANWSTAFAALKVSREPAIVEQAWQLALIFDDPVALEAMLKQAGDRAEPVAVRQRAVQGLISKKARGVAALLLELMLDPATRSAALRGLAEFDLGETPATILKNYSEFDSASRQDAIQTLASRPAWAMKLLDAIESKQIPRSDLSAFTARQLASLGDPQLTERVKKLWGELRASPADKTRLIADFKKKLTPEVLAQADRSAGRALFQKTCANCHRLFDAGASIGPDITGAQRTNLDYLLENIVDPSASVARDYQMQIIETTAGRVVTGLAVAETPAAVTIQTANEKLVVPVSEISERVTSAVSMMPDGLLQQLSVGDVRNLVAYLAGARQAALPLDQPVGSPSR